MLVRTACRMPLAFIQHPFRSLVHNSKPSECFRRTVKGSSLAPSLGKVRAYSTKEEAKADVLETRTILLMCFIAMGHVCSKIESEEPNQGSNMQITNQSTTRHLPPATPQVDFHDAISDFFRKKLQSDQSQLENSLTPRTLEDILEVFSQARAVADRSPELFVSLIKKAIRALRASHSHKGAIEEMPPSQNKEDLKMLQFLASHANALVGLYIPGLEILNLSKEVAPASLPIALQFVIQNCNDKSDMMTSTLAISQWAKEEEKIALFRAAYQNLRHRQEKLWERAGQSQSWEGSLEQSIPNCHDEATRAHCNLLLAYLQNVGWLGPNQGLLINSLPDTYCKKNELRSVYMRDLSHIEYINAVSEVGIDPFSGVSANDFLDSNRKQLSAIILRETP